MRNFYEKLKVARQLRISNKSIHIQNYGLCLEIIWGPSLDNS